MDGKRFKEIRLFLCITPKEMAEMFYKEYQTIARWESADKIPEQIAGQMEIMFRMSVDNQIEKAFETLKNSRVKSPADFEEFVEFCKKHTVRGGVTGQ